MIPPEAQYNLDGTYYKRGRFGFFYRWINGDWVKADLDMDAEREIRKSLVYRVRAH